MLNFFLENYTNSEGVYLTQTYCHTFKSFFETVFSMRIQLFTSVDNSEWNSIRPPGFPFPATHTHRWEKPYFRVSSLLSLLFVCFCQSNLLDIKYLVEVPSESLSYYFSNLTARLNVHGSLMLLLLLMMMMIIINVLIILIMLYYY